MLSILVGGVAFETPPGPVLPAAAADSVFNLSHDHAEAFRLPAQAPQTYLLVFKQSVRGLAPGAPVEFRGIPVGEVTAISAQIDAKTFEFSSPITIHLDAQQLGVKVRDLAPGANIEEMRKKLIEAFVAHGVRAQLRTGNLLTGALYVALDFFPDAAPVTMDWSQDPAQLPTIPGQLEAVEANVASIIKKLDEVPFKAIGEDLRKSIGDFDKTLLSARETLDNADKMIEPNSVLGAQLGNTLEEFNRAARSVRVLADYLERNPEALVRGKKGEAK
jgi:paraquat-inducible protein B